MQTQTQTQTILKIATLILFAIPLLCSCSDEIYQTFSNQTNCTSDRFFNVEYSNYKYDKNNNDYAT